MTPDEIIAMQADALAGTPGEWRLFSTIPQEGWDGWTIKAQPSPLLRGFSLEIALVPGPQSIESTGANARRIARVPRMEATITAQAAEIERLRAALDQQCDNMAFVVNHVTMPSQWLNKFTVELEQDRAALEAKP